jgi:hypothetical protein
LAKKTAQGIKAVANKKQVIFKIEYPCNSPDVIAPKKTGVLH